MNSVLVGWKLYYADASVIDSTQMKFENAPNGGTEVLVKWYETDEGKYSVEVQSGLDTYVLDSDTKNVKLGHNIRKERFEEILNIAMADKIPVIGI